MGSFISHSFIFTKKISNFSIPIIISPLKFSELIALLTSGNDKSIPQDLEKFTKHHKCDETIFSECIIKENLGGIISNICRDNMPSVYDFNWLFGIFDSEDLIDCELASKHSANPPEQYRPEKIPNYKINALTPTIGLYGQFMLCIYLQFVKAYNDPITTWKSIWPLCGPGELKNKDFLSAEINKLERLLEGYVDNKTEFQKYKEKVSNRLADLIVRFSAIPSHEREVLLNFNTFIQLANTSIKVAQ